MSKVITVRQFRADICNIMDETGKINNVVMVSEDDWNDINETLYINSIAGLFESIKYSMSLEYSEFTEEVEW